MSADELPGDTGFLGAAPLSPEAERLYAEDRDRFGYVMNLSRVWAHLPGTHDDLFGLLARATEAAGLTFRQRGVLVSALASTMGDPHCSLAWGSRLAAEAGDDVAAGVLQGDDSGLEPAERTLAAWARQLARDPNGTEADDVEALRVAGYGDEQIVALTVYVALRIAFSTVNDALGARPDRELVESAPGPVRDVVTFGRPADAQSPA
jgi:alkylhydroperoxidase family enzyme